MDVFFLMLCIFSLTHVLDIESSPVHLAEFHITISAININIPTAIAAFKIGSIGVCDNSTRLMSDKSIKLSSICDTYFHFLF